MTVDIMMPFYGDPHQFRLAVESVRAQGDSDWRLVVIDDQYPDLEPGRWVSSLGDQRIVYVRNAENLGVSGNFRRSVELAEAGLVTLMGCDDLLLPGYVARMHELATEHPDASYLQPGVVVIDGEGRRSDPLPDRVKRHYAPRVAGPTPMAGERLATGLARGNWTYFPSICWRLTALHDYPFDPDLDVALDLDLQFRIIDGGGSIVVDDVETFAYRRHSGSVSSWKANDGTRFIEEKLVLDKAAERARARSWPRTERAARRRVSSRLSALSRIPDAIRARDRSGIRSLLSHALR